ncbi:MAG: OmpA family protein [Deltaproteobacteria bacterium]|nr:OmpA family protein [Deltaproteobacteria bacterium]
MKTLLGFGFISVTTLMLGCGSNQPSSQLVQARTAMQSADQARASTYAPKDLYEAQKLLAKAEAAHKDDPRSGDETHYAYLAHRKTLTAVAHAQAEQARLEREKNQEAYTTTLERRSADLKEENNKKELDLVRTTGKLETTQAAAQQDQARLNQANQQLTQKEQALAAETQARQEAEARADAALKDLQAMAAVKQDRERLVITFAGSVLFESGKSVLLGTAKEKMQPLATALRNYKSGDPVVIQGHTDDRGSDSFNQQLSQARAESVRVYLIENGVPPAAVVAVGKGESEPVAANSSPEGRANNRRVEVIVPHRDQLSMQQAQ